MSPDNFNINLDRYRVIDISYSVKPNEGDPVRPFHTARSDTLPDGRDTEIVQTHTHVGTHIETAKHFFREGKTVSDFPLETFMGKSCLLSIDDRSGDNLSMDNKYLERKFDGLIQRNDIVVWRNDSTGYDSSTSHPDEDLPYFTPESAGYFVKKGVKMVVMGNVKFGKDIETGNEFEGQLHDADIPIVEIPDNLHDINRQRFYVMALPYKVTGLGSSWARAIVIEER